MSFFLYYHIFPFPRNNQKLVQLAVKVSPNFQKLCLEALRDMESNTIPWSDVQDSTSGVTSGFKLLAQTLNHKNILQR